MCWPSISSFEICKTLVKCHKGPLHYMSLFWQDTAHWWKTRERERWGYRPVIPEGSWVGVITGLPSKTPSEKEGKGREGKEGEKRVGEEGVRCNGPLHPSCSRCYSGERITRDQPGQYAAVLISKEKKKERMKVVKQHLFSTKERQIKCQETPAFSPLPFYQGNCKSWLSCLPLSILLPLLSHLIPLETVLQSWERQGCTPGDGLTRSAQQEMAILCVSRTREIQHVNSAETRLKTLLLLTFLF